MNNDFLTEAKAVLAETNFNTEVMDLNSLPHTFLALHIANEEENLDLQKKCLIRLMSAPEVLKVISYRVANYFGNYGCEAIDFIYKNTEKDEFVNYLWEKVREQLSKITTEIYDYPRDKDGKLDLSEETFSTKITACIWNTSKYAFRTLLVEKCKEQGMNGLHQYQLSDYALIRKVCKYEITLQNTNEEIMRCFESHWKTNKRATEENKLCMGSKNLTVSILENIRKGFIYTEEKDKVVDFDLSKVVSNDLLKKGFSKLSHLQQQIVAMAWLNEEKVTNKEVGAKVKLSEDQVRYQKRKALEILKNEFEQEN